MKRSKQGFTLVEIMIVVAIIGLLAAIAIPSFIKARENTYTQKQANNSRIVDAAKDQYLIDNNLSTTNAPTFTYANLSNYVKIAQTDLETVGGKSLTYGTGTAGAHY